ncbi:MAG: S9 family peptidase [Acidimicrobiales bacterium]
MLPEPAAPRRPHVHLAHGDKRRDDWAWLANRDDPAVVEYLAAENDYAAAVSAPTKALEESLFAEMRSRIVESDLSAPWHHGDHWYWTRPVEGLQYSIHCRRTDPDRSLRATDVLAGAAGEAAAGEVVLDENVLAEGHDYFSLGVFDVSPDGALLAYAIDVDGSERHQLRWRDLASGEDLDDIVEGVVYGSAWAADNRTLFYVMPDAAMRPHQVWRHTLGEPASLDRLVYEETDERFYLGVGATRSAEFVVMHSESKTTSEARWLPASDPGASPRVVLAREPGVEYDVDHAVHPNDGDVWLVRTNRSSSDGTPATDFALHRLKMGEQDPAAMVSVLAHRRGVKLESVEAFATHLVVREREEGIEALRILGWDGTGERTVAQPDPVYSLAGGVNADFHTDTYRFGYTSLATPYSSVDYHLQGGDREVIKVQPVRDYDPSGFQTRRLWATAPDGVRVPISLVAPVDQPLDNSSPCLLYGYGAYEVNIDPAFSILRLNLLARGFSFAIAHVRGGGELGRAWYEEGKLGNKANTFSDFIACAEHLIAEGWTSPERLVIRGASAGGLLMGAVTNQRPELWRAVVAEVPFVDVVTTMSDPSLPLTVTEWEEWGNPIEDPAAYYTMKAYSPYDNVSAKDYPAMYLTAGLNDPRVGFWEPAKWVAKLRAQRTNKCRIVLHIEMGAGHQGPSGRYDAWRDEARAQAFVLSEVGITS